MHIQTAARFDTDTMREANDIGVDHTQLFNPDLSYAFAAKARDGDFEAEE